MKPHALLAPAAALLLASCYNPKIDDAALKCSAKGECPSGFSCLDGRCHKGGGGAGGSGGMGGTGGPPPDGSDQICTVAMGPYGPFAGCAPKIEGECDAVCQAGCKCNERCKLDKDGPACHADAPPFAQQYDKCDQATDTCRPGFICLEELANRPDCAAHCYRLCRVDANCPTGSRCTDDVMVQGKVMGKACSIPLETCAPYGRAACGMPLGRPYPAFACYTVPGNTDQTACQCAGVIATGLPCENYFDCEPGSECVALGADRKCRKVCLVGAVGATTPGACPGTQVCVMFQGGTKYGYCR